MRNYPKIFDQNASQLFLRVRCWDAFLVLRNSPKVTTTSIMESLYTPLIRTLCFIFESTDNYSKDLSGTQKFKNLSISLARRLQKMESCNFINNQLTLDSHLLFATGKNFSVINLQIKFQRSRLFSWVTSKVRICRLSVSEQNIKLKTKQYLHITLML